MMNFKILWADSLGAKTFCTYIKDGKILIDPGVAIMHKSFPAPERLKKKWVKEGYKKILEHAEKSEVVIITHYHYDHYTDFEKKIYEGKMILAKSPNSYINDSQRKRALKFYTNLFKSSGMKLNDLMEDPVELSYDNPLNELSHALSIEYGDYKKRKEELMEKGMKWYLNRVKKWNSYRRIPEGDFKEFKLRFVDGKTFEHKGVKIKFSKPLFHGVEFSRVGWVLSIIIESEKEKLIFTSDIDGPIIEDYADFIIKEKPDYLLLDGPATYTLGYMLNLINLRRAIKNICRIIKESNARLIILDHHLLREKKFKERLKEVYDLAKREGVMVTTLAEYLGLKPAVLRDYES